MEGGNAESELPIEPGVTDPATEQKKPYIGSLACMSTTARVLAFGVVSGLIWSLALILLFGGSGSAGEATVVLASGNLSGVLVSVALQRPLAKFGRLGAFVAGLLSLPLAHSYSAFSVS